MHLRIQTLEADLKIEVIHGIDQQTREYAELVLIALVVIALALIILVLTNIFKKVS